LGAGGAGVVVVLPPTGVGSRGAEVAIAGATITLAAATVIAPEKILLRYFAPVAMADPPLVFRIVILIDDANKQESIVRAFNRTNVADEIISAAK
jgi:hypothetical protein